MIGFYIIDAKMKKLLNKVNARMWNGGMEEAVAESYFHFLNMYALKHVGKKPKFSF